MVSSEPLSKEHYFPLNFDGSPCQLPLSLSSLWARRPRVLLSKGHFIQRGSLKYIFCHWDKVKTVSRVKEGGALHPQQSWIVAASLVPVSGTAMVCLQNLRKTFKYGGRKNVPSIEEIAAISVRIDGFTRSSLEIVHVFRSDTAFVLDAVQAGRNSKRQIYRLPGGTERVINTKSTSVVQDIIEEICSILNVRNQHEMEEFSLYCIVEGDTFTMPLSREEYILDVTTELQRNQQIFYLIFCRSVWYYSLRLDNQLYIEVVFNQIAPDYLEGLLLVMPGGQLKQEAVVRMVWSVHSTDTKQTRARTHIFVADLGIITDWEPFLCLQFDLARVAALLHRAAQMESMPTLKETKYLLPKPVLNIKDISPPQWVSMVQNSWKSVERISATDAKAQVLG